MQKIKPNLILTVGVAVLLVGGGIAAYYTLVSRKFLEGVPLGANVVPQEAMVAVSLSTDTQQWDKLNQYGTPQSQAALQDILKDWQNRVFTDNGYDYQKDIQPWVGKEIMVAFLPHSSLLSGTPPTTDSSSTLNQQAMVMVLPIANRAKAKELLSQPKTIPQGQTTQRSYRGVDIIETQGNPKQNYSMAVLGEDFLVVTTDPNATERAIDTYRGSGSLAKTPGYPAALEKIKTTNPFAQVYLNIPVATTVASYHSARPIPTEKLEQVQQHQGLATNITLESQGVGLKSVSWLKPNSQKKFTVENQAQESLKWIPENTLMMVSGSNLKRVWEDYTQGANANPIAPFNPQVLSSSFKSATGMELEKDVLNWMNGAFSLSLVPANPNPRALERFVAGLVLTVKVNDRTAADKSLTQLDEVMKNKKFKVSETKIKGQPAVQWVSPFGGFLVTRGWLEGDVAFMTLGGSIADQIVPIPQVPITSNPLFQQSVPMGLNPNNGNFFMNVERVFDPKVRTLSLPQLPPQQKVWVDAIQSIGLTTAILSDRTSRYDIFVKVKTATTQPTETPSKQP
ncbi:conserved exported hypothetical protein [Planktothrix serta PCC 8927]|uniref:DUF3352 domain-containing protein n=1 Tax=Planktothrix serta PCC 8927 TaxID=671068 RepID=A0A7Z9BQB0_9CYAN|nr:DUF3352 domain-containing protein [Planktothrix serta]VXD15068.1 conserved exported hypothetical protein [Planktothrix serta PCC 8927]